MPVSIPRFVRWSILLAVVIALVTAGFQVFQYWDTKQTAWGPLESSDRDLLVKVRQAGLWEIPTSEMAQQRGTTARVREVGRLLTAEHIDLDQQVRKAAARLGARIPNQPTKQQQVWIAEIAGKSGMDFDRTYVQRLRRAHGKILPIISEVRASTQNTMMRSVADTGHDFVHRHIEYLESTGLVDSSALPAPPSPHTTGLPPGSVAASAAIPAQALAQAYITGPDQKLDQFAQAFSIGGARYLAALVAVLALLTAAAGLFLLLGRSGPRTRDRHDSLPAPRTPAEVPTRSRHSAPR